MPTYRPVYSKLVFITCADNERANNFAFWIYQRLKYADFPVCTYYVDDAPGAGGFTDRSIESADPVIVVLSNTVTRFDQAKHDLEIAQDRGKDIYLALFEEVEMPKQIQQWKIFDFRLT
jgi:hypothetical protein